MKTDKSKGALLIIVVLMAFVVYFFSDNFISDPKETIDYTKVYSNTVYIDTAGRFSLFVPSGWELRYEVSLYDSGRDWKTESKGVELKPINASHENIALRIIRAEDSSDVKTELETLYSSLDSTKDQFNTISQILIGEWPAVHQYTDFIGHGGIEAFKKHRYIIGVEDVIVEALFDESNRHDWDAGSEYDASEYLDDVFNILGSLSKIK